MSKISDETLRQYKSRLFNRLVTSLDSHFRGMISQISGQIMALHDLHRPQLLPEQAIFPDGTRYFWQAAGESIIVYEEKPKVRTVNIQKINARLAFPYIIYVGTFAKPSLGELWELRNILIKYRKTPLNSLDDLVYEANLPNVDGAGRACRTYFSPPVGVKSNICEYFLEWIRYFWSSEFTSEWGNSCMKYAVKEPRLGSVSEWAKATQENPLFFLDVNLEKEMPLRRVIGVASHWLPSSCSGILTAELLEVIRRCVDEIRDSWKQPETLALDQELLDLTKEN